MAEYSKIIRGTWTQGAANAAKFVSLPMVPDSFEWWNETRWATTANKQVTQGLAFQPETGVAYLTQSNGTENLGVISSQNICQFISAGSPTFGPAFTITGIVASTGVVTTSAANGYAVGDTVWLTGTTGELQIAGTMTTITAIDSPTTFTIGNIPTSGFAANATAGSVRKVLYPDLYIPFACPISAITQAVSAVVTTAVNHAFVVGQEVFLVVPSQWGMTQIDSFQYQKTNAKPQVALVTAVTATTVTLNINSTGFTAFAYPTSATAALGVTPAQIMAIGDQNTGYSLTSSGTVPYLGINNGVIGIPGAFAANTRQGVILAAADGTTSTIMNASDVIAFRAIFPDAVLLND